jgi:mono/diheme cytochrome c family protein
VYYNINKYIDTMKKNILFFASALAFTVLVGACGGGATETTQDTTVKVEEVVAAPASASPYAAGEKIYKEKCQVCHQETGLGIAGAFPPLAGSDYLLADKNRALHQVIKGSQGDIVVNGQKFSGVMPPQVTTAEDAQAVVNYVLNTWGNAGGEVTLEDAQKAMAM